MGEVAVRLGDVTDQSPRLRRFLRACADLGFTPPPDWCHEQGGSVGFGDLSDAAFDRLVRLLEDLGDTAPSRPSPSHEVRDHPADTPRKPTPPVSGPYNPERRSTLHMEVPS
jgi:hypothetical protein